MRDQLICKHCGGPLIQKATKPSAAQQKKPYYYTAYYACEKCHRLYHDDKFKVTNTPLFEKEKLPERSWIPQGHLPQSGGRSQDDGEKKNNNVILGPDEGGRLLDRGGKDSDSRIQYDVEIWTDGACINNGTPQARASWGFVSGKTERAGLVEGKQTNNIAEALAIYHALVWAAEKGYRRIRLHTDSQISLHGIKKTPHLVKANKEIFEDIARVIQGTHLQIDFIKVLGHSGDYNNDRVDKVANDLARKGA